MLLDLRPAVAAAADPVMQSGGLLLDLIPRSTPQGQQQQPVMAASSVGGTRWRLWYCPTCSAVFDGADCPACAARAADDLRLLELELMDV